MACFIIAEALTDETEIAKLEITEIDARGLASDGSGTLLNERRGSVINGPRRPRDPNDASLTGYQRFVALKRRGRERLLAPGAAFRRAGRALTSNPKSPNGAGAAYLDLYPPTAEVISVEAMLAKGRALGFTDTQQLGHLAWDLDHGFIEMVA